MTASELRALAERLCAVEPHDYEDRQITEAASEVLELIAWAEEARVNVIWGERPTVIVPKNDATSGDTLIDTLRRAREASKS